MSRPATMDAKRSPEADHPRIMSPLWVEVFKVRILL
jgi:hypothetical protein